MLKKYFNKDELRAFIICFFAVAAAQAITEWNNFFDDFSKQTAISLLSALLKAGFEAFFIVKIKPSLITQTQVTTTVTSTDPPAPAPVIAPVQTTENPVENITP